MFDIQAVLFDLDGTLVDTVHDIAGSMNSLLREMGEERFDTDDYRRWIGGGSGAMVARISEMLGIEEPVESFLERYMQRYGQNLTTLSRPFAGAEDILDTCRELDLPISVLSNKDQWMVDIICRELFPDVAFRHTIGLSSAFPKKPDPTSARHIARDLVVNPRHCLFVGDTPVDIRTAQAAGMTSAGVTWGYGHALDIDEAGPDVCFRRMNILDHFIRDHCSSARRRISA
ncbi:HAD family hydrolase [Breoghania sp.]|uniref:HAD family hydrolase n=1 Tax=Breoghania sp. TaxID=2065378 RepID=UPI002AA774EF|nr:HAD family hydrolase [Breoghania sp.]